MIPLRDETTKSYGRLPIITWLLIGANIYFYFASVPITIELFGLKASELLAGKNLINLITSMFLHGSLLHLVFNMWSLWIFGYDVEGHLGSFKYIVLYVLAGLIEGIAFALFATRPESLAIGASGAISGVIGAYLVLHPQNRILTLIPLGFFITTARISAPIFIIIWFILQFVGFAYAQDAVAYSAHIGGFITGIIFGIAYRTPSDKY